MSNLTASALPGPIQSLFRHWAVASASLLLAFCAATLYVIQDKSWVPYAFILGITTTVFLISLALPSRRLERDIFGIGFGLYLVAGAVFQWINAPSGSLFGMPDSTTFYNAATGYLGRVPLVPMYFVAGRSGVDSTLPVFVYQHVIDFVQRFERAPIVWPMLMTNAFISASGVALTASLARMAFQGRKAPVLAACLFAMLCPMHFLYTTELLRDDFVYLLVVIMLISGATIVTRNSLLQRIAAAIAILCSLALMTFARLQFLAIGAVIIGSLPVISLVFGRRTPTKAILAALAALVVLAVVIALVPALLTLMDAAKNFRTIYSGAAEGNSGLGYTLVVALPLPVRLIPGILYQHVFPIPLWAFFGQGLALSYWFVGLNGIWSVLLVPAAVTGLSMLLSRRLPASFDRRILCLLAMVYGALIVIISLTTLEVRHTSAGYAAFFILAAAPFSNPKPAWPLLRTVSKAWLGAVIGVHLVWALLKVAA